MEVIPIILTGGSGKRLWPISRSQYPKQFLPLVNEMTMLQDTASRLNGIDNISNELIAVCNEDHKYLVSKQLAEINIKDPAIIVEPVPKNTAAAIYAASLYATYQRDPRESILLILPSDHFIDDIDEFLASINKASDIAKEGKLVTLGVNPTKPSSEYGYIKKEELGNKVEKFIEKPEIEIAEGFLKEGGYFWNSGMFIFRADTLQQELKIFSKKTTENGDKSFTNSESKDGFIQLELESFKECPDISIDYALMEKTDNACVVPLNAGWSDLGSWTALHDISDKDDYGNTITGDVILRNTKDSYISSPDKLTTVLGVKGLTVVNTPDALFISSNQAINDINLLFSDLTNLNRSEKDLHRKVFRPWGWYDSLEKGDTFQVKRICVLPGSSISLQRHFHRSEHWTVVKGEGKVTCGNKISFLKENESIYIPKETIHRLENVSIRPVEIIEVQYGDYLGEDDIERLEDMFGRK